MTIFKELIYKIMVKLNPFFADSFLHPPICYIIIQYPTLVRTNHNSKILVAYFYLLRNS